ncbi:MAG: immune inhibitor A [Candidatus Helarchaeota archaeon]|nr:immune inhibitor A [Candidatus Helarchaeota archaeon]
MKFLKMIYLILFFTLILSFIYYNFKINFPVSLETRVENVNSLHLTSPLFDGMYYKWNGSYQDPVFNEDWRGTNNISLKSQGFYHVDEYINLWGSDLRDINESSRIFNGSGYWGSGYHEWLFIPVTVELGEMVPIAVGWMGDSDFDVSAEQTIAAPYLGRNFDCWKLTDEYSSEVYYDKYTGLLIQGTFIHGWGFYTIYATDTNVPFQDNFNAPNLTNGQVTPAIGNLSTTFKFSVNYTDIDNNWPKYVYAIIDGVPHTMSKQNLSDDNYRDGCIYEFETFLDNSSHVFYFNASDLKFSTRLPSSGNFSGPTVNYINLNAPMLSGHVDPPMGNNYTIFNFLTNYSDLDNNPPTYVNVTINGTSHEMTKVFPSDINFLDGCIYQYSTRLEGGVYEYYFNASDGVNTVRAPLIGNYSGPSVMTVYWALVDDVESGMDGWITTGTPSSNSTYGWHIINSTSNSPTHSWWCGDDDTGLFGYSWNASLVSPLLNLTVAFAANLTYYHKYEMDDGWDNCYVEIKINGTGTWDALATHTGSQASWVQNNINITSYVGNYVNIRFRFTSDISANWDGWFLDDIVVKTENNFNPPALDMGIVNPLIGNTTTIFNYTVKYSDVDNNPPVVMLLSIDGMPFVMSKINPSDVDYTDGCWYYYLTKLTNDTHLYSFAASDGLYIAQDPIGDNYSGPIVNYFNIFPPIFTEGQVTPFNGITSETYTFTVNYTDPENIAPSYINITINGIPYQMNKQNGSDDDYIDGCIYQYLTSLGEGIYSFHFNASDGDYEVWSPNVNEFAGPYVSTDVINNIVYTRTLSATNLFDGFRFLVYDYEWAGVAIRPPNGSNFDITYHALYNYSDTIAGSSISGSAIDFVAINGHDLSSTTNRYAKCYQVNNYGQYDFQAQFSVPDYSVPGGPYSGSITPNEIIDVFELFGHSANTTYNITLDVPTGLDLSLYIFNETGGKITALASSNRGGPGVDESVLFILPSTAEFAIIIVNENDATGSYSFQISVDVLPPDLIIESPLNKSYQTTTIDINLSSSAPDLDSIWYRVRNETGWITNNITWYLGANITLDEGNYTLNAWANDTQGYISAAYVVDFTVDITPPTIIIENPSNITFYENTFFINISCNASDLDAIWYRIFNLTLFDWIDLENVSYYIPIQRTLPDGFYQIFAWANDTAGNLQSVNESFAINAPPVVTIDTPLNVTYTTNGITINLNCSALDLDLMWYQVHNGTEWVVNKTIWAEGANVTLPDGIYTLYAWANDTFGQTQLMPSNVTFSIDTTAPTVTILSPTNDTYLSTSVWINLSSAASDLDSIWYRIYSNSTSDWLDPLNITWSDPIQRIFSDGYYTLYVWANDTFGNVPSYPKSINFTIDTPPQIISISIVNGTISTTGSLILNISVSAADLDTIWYRIFDGTSWITGNITWTETLTLQLGNGNYLLYIWVNDTQGNEVSIVISFTVQITTPGGPNNFIWIIVIIIIGAVTAVVILYRTKKSRKKKKSKAKDAKALKSFAERVKPMD